MSKYISWIPNTSGMLLYSLVEAWDYRTDRIVGDVFEIRDSNNNVIAKHYKEPFLISMLIDLRDEKNKEAPNKYTRVIFTACPNEDGKLQGNIYFLDNLKNPSIYKDETETSLIQELVKQETKKKWEDVLTELVKYYKSNRSTTVYSILEYSLEETGKIVIEHKEHTHQLDEEFIRAEVEQAYYFIKFIFHKDRFHSKKNEYIVPIIEDISNDDKSFLRISKGIIRHILSKRKESVNDFLDLKSLKGMIIYVKVLLNMISDETIKNKELMSLGFIDDGLTKELEQLRPVLLPNFRDFLDDFKSWSVIVFAIITPFIITSKHEFENLGTYLSDMALPYYGYGMLGLIVIIFLVNMVFQRKSYKSNFFGKRLSDIVNWTLFQIKKHSKPSLSKNVFCRKIFPRIIDIEMGIRRLKFDLKKIIFASISIVIFIGVGYGIFLLKNKYEKQAPVNARKKCIQGNKFKYESNVTVDSNQTLKNGLRMLNIPESKK